MANRTTVKYKKAPDLLQSVFPQWKIGRREIIWLWLTIKRLGYEFSSTNLHLPSIRQEIASYLTKNRSNHKIEYDRSLPLLPEETFDWIKESGRQPEWLFNNHQNRLQSDLENKYLSSHRRKDLNYLLSVDFPNELSFKDKLVALIDFEKESLFNNRSDLVLNLKEDWAAHQEEDRRFSWYFSPDKEKMKRRCQTPWQWYRENHKNEMRSVVEFTQQNDVLIFLDRTRFSLEEKQHHITEIKKKFNSQETQAKRQAQGKKQTNLSLSENARNQLDDLAREKGLTKTDIIEQLIFQAHKELST